MKVRRDGVWGPTRHALVACALLAASCGGGEGGSTANFVSSLIHSLPPVHDVAKMAGVELPDYLGKVKQDE